MQEDAQPNQTSSRRRRSGGRQAKLAARSTRQIPTTPYIQRKIPYFELHDTENLELIEHNAETILEEIGIDFRDDAEALQILKEGGADVDGERVRFPRGMCRRIIRDSAPKEFTQYARNPERNVLIGSRNTVFAPGYGMPFVHDIENGRRYGSIEDFRNIVKLTYMSPWLHHSGGTVCEPVDLPVNKRHFDMLYSHMKYSDKPFMGSVTSQERARDTVEMTRILFGDDFKNPLSGKPKTCLVSLINANSPMTFDGTMLGAAKEYARANQACIVAPFILAGAMSPVTVAGASAQILAEVMAGMTFIQLVQPGAPVIFGCFAASISMQTGAPTFGTPEPALVLYTVAALARRLMVPFRSGGSLCASKIPDAQAAAESVNTLIPTCLAGVNFVLHSAGWLEGGLAFGYEKFIIDNDQLGMMHTLLTGVDMSENAQAMSALREVGPGKHFLGCTHTQSNFEIAFYRSPIADNNSYEQWVSEGSQDIAKRANIAWKRQLAEYEAPALDSAVDEALLDYIAQRKSSFPDSNI